jgi:ubiquinone/menaquinone biosynthesis C-methylase UbiE
MLKTAFSLMKKTIKKLIRIPYRLFAKTRVAKSLLKQIIIRKYTRMNNESFTNNKVKTPWVCEFPYDIDRCLAYIHDEVSDYFIHSGMTIKDIAGKNILEIGPGENLGVALLLIAAGADKIVCIDRFNSLIDKSKQTEIYRRLLDTLTKEDRDRLKNVITIKDGKTLFNSDKVQYMNVSAEELNKFFPPKHFDFIISRAVLEHVLLIDSAMETMDLLLKTDGYMLHEVDFRDHGIFTSYKLPPLTFLSIDDKKWFKMTSNLGAPNRKLLGYYQTFFKNNGYVCDTVFLRLFYSDNIARKLKSLSNNDIDSSKVIKDKRRIHSSCKIVGDEDLIVAAAFFCAQKKK